MDTREAGRRGGFVRAKRLTPERLRRIAELGGQRSVELRRARRELARAQAARLNAESELAQFSLADRERLIYHANEIERIIRTRRSQSDLSEGDTCHEAH